MARPEHFDYVFKLVLIGDSNTGKTAASKRYTDNVFSPTVASTGVDFRFKMVQYRDRIIKVQVWDTAGQERYRCITSHFFRGAAGVMVFYDITSRDSFTHVSFWLDFVRNSCVPENARVMLVGCMSDMEQKRVVQKHEGESLAKKCGISFFEISNSTGDNVEECFTSMVKEMLSTITDGRHDVSIVNEPSSTASVNLEKQSFLSTQKSCCSKN